MTEDSLLIKDRAQRIVAEITMLIESQANVYDAGGPVSRLIEYVVDGDSSLYRDDYVLRFIFDAAQTVAAKPWKSERDVYDRLPPYGFRKEEEILRWAHWFGSHRKRPPFINRFLKEVQATDIRKSVHDLMFDTFRYEQVSVASKVLSYIKDDANWK
ncbi:MAG: hypothetical protein ACOX3E_07285 [Desulfomonilia bacterium]|jgi:hypothetical protein|uniref:Uncharacterized protein n=1 Tax=anaerobic digester metagenome TaxID=1263854 RepID=A0A485M100_9ZZZZ